MSTARYFKDNESYWKFEAGKHPQMKTSLHARWGDSFFHSLDEFLTDPGQVAEVREDEAEIKVISPGSSFVG